MGEETCVSVGVWGGGACMGDRDLCKCVCVGGGGHAWVIETCVSVGVGGGACMGDRDLCKCVCGGGGMHG